MDLRWKKNLEGKEMQLDSLQKTIEDQQKTMDGQQKTIEDQQEEIMLLREGMMLLRKQLDTALVTVADLQANKPTPESNVREKEPNHSRDTELNVTTSKEYPAGNSNNLDQEKQDN